MEGVPKHVLDVTKRPLARRIGAAAVLLAILCAAVAAAIMHAALSSRSSIEKASASLEDATGLVIGLHEPIEFALLPRPMLRARDITIKDRDGAIALQASFVRGTLAILPLLRGQVVLDRVQLADVTGSIDADAAAGRLLQESETDRSARATVPARVSVTSGLIEVRSAHPGASGFLTDMHGVIDGFRGGGATISGGASWHGERADISGRLDSLLQFLKAEPASGSLRIKSRLIGGTLVGTWKQGWRGSFAGSASLSSPDLPALLRLAGVSPGMFAGVRHASFSATAEPSQSGQAFTGSRLTLNESVFEGTLGVQSADGHLAIVGTLATDELNLGPMSASVLPIREGGGGWTEDAIPFSPADLHDVDLRISANRLLVNGLKADDAALSVLCRDGRMELSLGEARAYGGLVKARLFANGNASTLGLKVDASWSQVDVAALSDAIHVAADQIEGTAGGHITAEGKGSTISAVVQSLDGKGQASLHQGRLASTPAVDAVLHPNAGLRTEPGTESENRAFDLASVDFTISKGMLIVDNASVTGPDLHVAFTGQTSLLDKTFSFSSKSVAQDRTAPDRGAAPGMRIGGIWGGTVHRLEPADRDSPARFEPVAKELEP